MAGTVYQPTGVEQLFLELLNAARANPAAYGDSIGLDLSDVAASQPLAFDLELVEAARLHSQDMNDRRFFAHNNPDGLDPGDRIAAAGYDWKAYAESIAAGFDTPAEAVRALIVDSGVPDLGHRRHLLSIDSISATLPEVGVGIVLGGSGPYQHYYTIDSARDYYTSDPHGAFLTGVIYSDLDGDNFYSPGEGYSGVTVRAVGSGDASVTSFDSGGYSLTLPPGTYTVTASGAGLPDGLSATVTIGSSNLKLDFLPTGAVLAGGAGSTPEAELGVWTGLWEIDRDGDGTWDGPYAGDREYRFGSSRTDLPAPIDFNGDGLDELAVMRRGKALLIDSSGNRRWDGRAQDTRLLLGNGGDQAIVGDWNGDGRDDIGVWRNETGVFHLDTNGDRMLDAADSQFPFAPLQLGDLAVAGDWDGNGQHEVGIFRSDGTFLLDDGDRVWDAASDSQVNFVGVGLRPAVADFDGDGRTELAVFSGDTFQIDTDHDNTPDSVRPFTAGRYPVAGNWA